MAATDADSTAEPQRHARSSGTLTERLAFALRVVQVRLRFFFVLAAIFLVLTGWRWLQRARDWTLMNWSGPASSDAGVSPDTEYFCPMCPGVLSNWPEKCPVCKMPLVRRRKGEAQLLPEGVVARMQLSPYRLQLAGIQTAAVTYEPLERRWTSWGKVQPQLPRAAEIVDRDVVEILCSVSRADAPLVHPGQAVTIHTDQPANGDSLAGKVAAIEPATVSSQGVTDVRIEVTDVGARLRPGDLAQVEWRILLADLEPFRSQPRDPPALAPSDVRDVFFCDEHPRYLYRQAGTCPFHDRELQPSTLQSNQRVEWFCPAHAEITSREPGICERCGGLPLSPQVVTYSPAAQVLAIPESAVIDSGTHQTVFIESGMGMYDAVPVHVGRRAGAFVPVLSGLEPGQRVVVAGAFLLDAETRLDPNLAASYFGAGSRSFADSHKPDIASTQSTDARLSGLDIPASDRARIERQQVCPVTKLPLGSMGVPLRVQTGDQLVYLCCAGCRGRVRDASDVQTAVAEPAPVEGSDPGAHEP